MSEDAQSAGPKNPPGTTSRKKKASTKASTSKQTNKRVVDGKGQHAESDQSTIQAAIQPKLHHGDGSPGTGPKGVTTVVAYIALLVAVIALGLGGYLAYQTKLTAQLQVVEQTGAVKQLDVKISSLNEGRDKLAAKQEVLEEMHRVLQDQLRSAARQRSDVAVEVKQLGESLGKLYQRMDRSLQDLTLEEVEQLLLLANHRLRLAGDVAIATIALEMSDQRLRDLGDPGLVEVRRHIAEELAQLKGIEKLDLAGLALRLNSLALNLDGLKVQEQQITSIGKLDGQQVAEQSEKETGDWTQMFREIWQDLGGLVRIQNVEKSYRPLLTPEQKYFLQENLSLMLSGAQLALLRLEQGVYRHNLNSAIIWVKKYYDVTDPGVKKLITELEELAGKAVKMDIPDISASLVALRSIKTARAAKL